jgi:CRISPR/Cas system CMR-associated protein Cmr3 (group 5 of RAMP superfamily)
LKTFYDNELIKIESEYGIAAAFEAKRIAEKYQKDFLCCDDLVEIMRVGKNNVRELMNGGQFPTIEIGNRKVVSVISFVLWSLKRDYGAL